MLVRFDRLSGIFVRPHDIDSDEVGEVCAKLNEALAEVRGWLNLKRRSGKYAHGFLVELSFHAVARSYNVHAIYDEIGKLEGRDTRPSRTKKFRQMRPPLRGLWHKHHFQARFIPQNLIDETERMVKDGRWEKMFAPHYGKDVDEFADQIAHEMVIGAYERRARDHRMTGEFIVYEPQSDGSNYYLTLGSHRDYDAIRTRVDTYKQFDQG